MPMSFYVKDINYTVRMVLHYNLYSRHQKIIAWANCCTLKFTSIYGKNLHHIVDIHMKSTSYCDYDT